MVDDQAYRAFWQSVENRLPSGGEEFQPRASSDPNRYKSLSTGIPQVVYSLEFRARPKIGINVCVYFEGTREFNSALFNYAYEHKDKIESEFGETLEWENPSDKNVRWIGIYLLDRTIHDDKTTLDKAADWVISTVARLRETVVPFIREARMHAFGKVPDPRDPRWDKFVALAQAYVDSGRLEEEEITYKVKTGQNLAAARESVLAGVDGWDLRVKRGFTGNLIHPITQSKFRNWIDQFPSDALSALQAIWTEKVSSVAERIHNFCNLTPPSAFSGTGIRMNVASVLLMGLDVDQYPPFRVTVFNNLYELTQYDHPQQNADEAQLYQHALGFLDRFINEAAQRGLTLRHRLDAQSVAWAIHQERVPPEHDLDALAEHLLLPIDFLRGIEQLLDEKPQVIFQGPPGTGKTYVARALAKHLAGSEDHVTLVQFHPSYAYEDFVQGFRPTESDDGQLRFALTDGPLVRAAKAAKADSEAKHFLIIDEINRGNLGKILGELYFLLEYRDEAVYLQYQKEGDKPFSLPKNLYIIGTMNTADRSIALVDLALRRRFNFVEFDMNEEPVKGLLRRWLTANGLDHMEWVADVVEEANKQLDDVHAAIGPSYFMRKDKDGNPSLNEEDVKRIWKHSILPYIEERRFGDRNTRDQFDLGKLRSEAARSRGQQTAVSQGEGNGDNAGDGNQGDASDATD